MITIQLEQASFHLISKNKKVEIATSLPDSLAASAELQQISALSSAVDLGKNNNKQGLTIEKGISLLSNHSLEDRVVMDSLGISEARQKNESFQMLFHQFRRVVQKDLDVFIPHLLKNLPFMMFILLPLFAFFLKNLFRNKPNLFIPHVIHSLHIHSMAFLLLTLFIVIGWLSNVYFFWATFFLITLYSFLSIKYVYKQSLMRTAWKFILLGMFYFSSIFLFVMLEVGISFLTF